MKILMIITGMCSGGAERVMATLCNELIKNNHVRLLSLKDDHTDYQIDAKVEFIGGNVKRWDALKASIFVKKQMEEYKPDVCVSFMTKTNIIALIAKKISKQKPPVVIAERANPYYTTGVLAWIRKKVYPLADACVFQTSLAQDYYKDLLKCNSIVIRNPINPDFRIRPYKGQKSKRIVTVGRLSTEKNQKLLIDAFGKVADKYPEYTVEIYGDGPLKEELTQQIEVSGLTDRVKLMGRKENIQDYIKDAEIFVLPSNSEGMPNALLEAMALGLACIATDCPIGGSAVIIRNEINGLLIPMNDISKLAKSIERLIEDKVFSDSLREKATQVIEYFDATQVCNEWEQYLDTIVHK